MLRKTFLLLVAFVFLFCCLPIRPTSASPNSLVPSLSWFTCGTCPTPEVTISGNEITMGISNRLESSSQNSSFHGAAALLTPASKYVITFSYDLFSWDSYFSPTQLGKGYWDSFSVSVSSLPHWQLSFSDPITNANIPGLGFIWGGTSWGDGILKHVSGSKTVQVSGNPNGNNYLNVVLNTSTQPHADNLFPSWGKISITNLEVITDINLDTIRSQAAEIAKTAVGGDYLWGGKGWNMQVPREYVSLDKILTTGYNYWNPVKIPQPGVDFGTGLDCSGLVYWAYNRAAGSTRFPGYPINQEGASGQKYSNTTAISESELQPGDLLFFKKSATDTTITHVAMYVGGADPNKNIVEAASTGVGIIYSSLNTRKTAVNFHSYGRVIINQPQFIVQSHSPVTLIVTDPDGFTVNSETFVNTGEEYIRGIPGVLYYATNEYGDDIVYAPILKIGTYSIKVVPKPDALPTDIYGLEIFGAGKLVSLAQDTPISQIPIEYRIYSSGLEINPVPHQIFLPIIMSGGSATSNATSTNGVELNNSCTR